MRLPFKVTKKVYVKDDLYSAWIMLQKIPKPVSEHLDEVDNIIKDQIYRAQDTQNLKLYRRTIFYKYAVFKWFGFKDASLRDLEFSIEYAILFDQLFPDLYTWLMKEYDIFSEEQNA